MSNVKAGMNRLSQVTSEPPPDVGLRAVTEGKSNTDAKLAVPNENTDLAENMAAQIEKELVTGVQTGDDRAIVAGAMGRSRNPIVLQGDRYLRQPRTEVQSRYEEKRDQYAIKHVDQTEVAKAIYEANQAKKAQKRKQPMRTAKQKSNEEKEEKKTTRKRKGATKKGKSGKEEKGIGKSKKSKTGKEATKKTSPEPQQGNQQQDEDEDWMDNVYRQGSANERAKRTRKKGRGQEDNDDDK